MPIKIDYEKCCWKDSKCTSCCCGGKTCNGCVEACPTGAMTRGKKVEYDQSLCTDCQACIAACSHEAISLA
ncbi:4Fe-4S binding protein [Candidatus Woesearchaeota archaeon]|nr:4Fe-4S binding protein [Candidatus Woesearchaeota archaeon]